MKRLKRKEKHFTKKGAKALAQEFDWNRPGENVQTQTKRIAKARAERDRAQKEAVRIAGRLGRKEAEGKARKKTSWKRIKSSKKKAKETRPRHMGPPVKPDTRSKIEKADDEFKARDRAGYYDN